MGFARSPSLGEEFDWELFDGFSYEKGSIFQALTSNNKKWRLYNDRRNQFSDDPSPWWEFGWIPQVATLKGVHLWDVHSLDQFKDDLNNEDGYPYSYTFIEPNYGESVFDTYKGGSSQHPEDDPTGGEGLIKYVYEAIRNSPVWNTSLLIVTYDEHGGFYDSVIPGKAVPATGAASSFAPTYALGQVARRYYAGGRTMSTQVLKDAYASLLVQGRGLQAQYDATDRAAGTDGGRQQDRPDGAGQLTRGRVRHADGGIHDRRVQSHFGVRRQSRGRLREQLGGLPVSPEQMFNLAAIVWLYRGQQQRFVGLVKEYLGRVCAESAAVPGTLPPFESTLADLRGRFDALARAVTKQGDLCAEKQQGLADDVKRAGTRYGLGGERLAELDEVHPLEA